MMAINHAFTLLEIKAAIKMLKNNKACGVDKCISINSSIIVVMITCALIVDFFNIVLSTGYVPNIKGGPIYKNKGSIVEPANYRGIPLLSCTCKLFAACFRGVHYY